MRIAIINIKKVKYNIKKTISPAGYHIIILKSKEF